jgi:diguanylate cyclase (GGDEF)-like protein/PAS domain S-box-containing protein
MVKTGGKNNRPKTPKKSPGNFHKTLFDAAGIALLIVRKDGTIDLANREFMNLSGYSPEALEGKKKWTEFLPEQGAFPADGRCKLVDKQGRFKDVFVAIRKIPRSTESAVSFLDIGGFAGSTEQTRTSEVKYRSIVESTDDAVYMVDIDCRYLFANEKALTGLGLPEDAVIGKRYGDFHTFEDAREFQNVVDRVFETGESHRYEHKNNKAERYFLRTLSPVRDVHTQQIKHVTVISKEITELKKTEEKLKYLSLHDVLTGLYNRAYFEEEMRRIDTGRFDLVGLIICDIDGLKLVNDTLGHDRGDELIRTASRVIRESFRESDVVARVGGDEFAILLPNSPQSKVENICARIRNAIASYNKTNPKLPLSISTGYAVRSGYTKNVSELYREADNNMYKEKLYSSQNARNAIIRNLINTAETKGLITRDERERFQGMVTALAGAVELSEERIKDLHLLAQFHDIGNAGIQEHILFKPDRFTADELLEVQKHTDIGHRIAQAAPELTRIADLILKHHEWWNGNGYPLGLKGEEIPLESRIIALATAYDAMTNPRPYRDAMSRQEAIAELRKCSGTQFDPRLVEKFIKTISSE